VGAASSSRAARGIARRVHALGIRACVTRIPRFMPCQPRPRATSVSGALRRLAVAAAPLAGSALLAGCCVAPPTAEEWAAIAYRRPEETLESFQVAVRARSPLLEYRCLSVGFRERHALSQILWREYRERWYAENPFLRKGIADARIVTSEPIGARRHRLVVESHGRRMAVELVREDFYQVFVRGELAADELLPEQGRLERYLGARGSDRGGVLVESAVELPPGALSDEPSELRVGSEWKIDWLEELTGEAAAAAPRT
jgi:hypothetical protein